MLKIKDKLGYIKHTVVPCAALSGVAGILTGGLIFLFKVVSAKVIELSGRLYNDARGDIKKTLLLLLGSLAIGAISGLILKFAKDCRGGGIPAAVASIKNDTPLKWIQGIFVLFFTSLITYLGGVPLGNEGPSVQMGTAVGKGTTAILGRKNRAWERYVMTGGACAGFATATCAPLTGIIFALEEVHRRFSPMIFLAASTAVLTGTVTQDMLSRIFSYDASMFSFKFEGILTASELPVAILIGLLSAFVGIIFTLLYKKIRNFISKFLKKYYIIVIMSIFLVCALLGLISGDFLGSGHSLIHEILEDKAVWYMLIIALAVRALTMITSNTSGVSGGVFLPILTFGAILGALSGKLFIYMGIVRAEVYPVLIASSMAAFLAVASRTPITAIAFSAEVLCGVESILPIAVAVTVGYIVAEMTGITSFNDAIIESKVEEAQEGKTAQVLDTYYTVKNGSFASGREVRDILWPPRCSVLSVQKANNSHDPALAPGDILRVYCTTYSMDHTKEVLTSILGKQD